MKPFRSTWPAAWPAGFDALCKFYGIHAHAASIGEVLLLTGQGAPFAKVPTGISLDKLQFAVPLLLDSFELGCLNGEARIKARMSALLRVDKSLGIPDQT